MSILPNGYKDPTAGGNYMKLEKGENKFRILNNPIFGWETWVDDKEGNRKPLRKREEEPFDLIKDEVTDESSIKYFWAMIVWNHQLEKVQILEITQKGIRKAIEALDRSKDWGDAKEYDIVITREGDGFDTEYSVMPVKPAPLTKEMAQAFAKSNINLDALYDGLDPFITPVKMDVPKTKEEQDDRFDNPDNI